MVEHAPAGGVVGIDLDVARARGDDFLNGGAQADDLHGGSGDDDMQGDSVLNYRNDGCDGGDGIDTARLDCDSVSNVP